MDKFMDEQQQEQHMEKIVNDYHDYFQIDSTDHFIFGKIKIFQEWNYRQNLLFRKVHFNKTKEEQEQDIEEVQERIKINHPNLLNLMNFVSVPPDSNHSYYQLNIIYDYPSQFFKPDYEYKMHKKQKFSSYLILCLGTDILNAIHYLKKNQKYHGDIRPRYIAASSDKKNHFILCDRLKDTQDAFDLQRQHLRDSNCRLYLSPNLLKALVTGNRELAGSEYKNEMFALGMLMLEIGCLGDIQSIYNKQTGDFDQQRLEQQLRYMESRHKENKVLMNFIKQLLTVDQEKMPSAKDMLLAIQRETGKMNEKVKMGLDQFEKIYDRHDDDYEFMNRQGNEQNPNFNTGTDFTPIQQITKLDPKESVLPIGQNRYVNKNTPVQIQSYQQQTNNYGQVYPSSQQNVKFEDKYQPIQNSRSNSRIIRRYVINDNSRSISRNNVEEQKQQPAYTFKQSKYSKYKS